MEKIIIYFVSLPLFLFLWFDGPKTTWVKSASAVADTIPPKSDAGGAKACADCHGQVMELKFKHNAKTTNACADCHVSNVADHPKNSIGLVKNLPDLCFSCHEDKKELVTTSPFVHKAVTEKKMCANCHSPHSSDNKKVLLASRKDLCLSCHNKSVKEDGTPAINFEKLMKGKTLHPPFEGCEKVCHNPHASSDRRLLDDPFPKNNYLSVASDSFALCWECHGSDMIEKPKSKGATSFRNGDQNLHWVHVHGDKGRSCMMCHNPHSTENLHLIRTDVKFGNWSFKMNYVPNENGGSCLPSCHQQRSYTR